MFFQILFVFLSLCAKASHPVVLSVGKPLWISHTCLHLPIHLQVAKGKHIYGPDAKNVIPTKVDVSGHNIVNVRARWPESEEKQGHAFYNNVPILLEIDLSGRGDAILNIDITGLACSHVCETFALKSVHKIKPNMPQGTWIKMLFFAFLGGLILNIMPCVLPVLGLKIKGFVRSDPVGFRAMCRLTIGGIVCGFWSMAVITILLKTLFGHSTGWGEHLLKSPVFASIMSMVMMAGAYSLWGVFQLHPPRWAGRLLTSKHASKMNDFLSGFLAVLLATPCSAPFLGASVGFALAGSPLEVFLFYTVIGIGFAFPYVLSLLFSLEKVMPKPGPWMNKVSIIMGFFFLGSSAWLAWIVFGFVDESWLLFSCGMWVAMAVWPVINGLPFLRHRSFLRYGMPCIMAVFFCLSVNVYHQNTASSSVSLRDGLIQWRVFSQKNLEEALKKNKIIYIDITGRGCALCMVNKRLYHNEKVQKWLTRSDVVCLRGDFSHDPNNILSFLRRYGRSAIPFNMLISRQYPQGVILSEYLTMAGLERGLSLIRSTLQSP